MTFHPKPKKKHIIAAIVFGMTILVIHTDLEPESITMAQRQMHEQIEHAIARKRIFSIGLFSIN